MTILDSKKASASEDDKVILVAPQMGEGLREVRLVAKLKQEGEHINVDEPLFAIETDKVSVEVESTHAGTVTKWLVDEGVVMPIGAAVVEIQSNHAVMLSHLENGNGSAPLITSPVRFSTPPLEEATKVTEVSRPSIADKLKVPPRTRAYCRSRGIDSAQIMSIPSVTGTLTIEDVQHYLALDVQRAQQAPQQLHHDIPLSERQRRFIGHASIPSSKWPIPAVVGRSISWETISKARKKVTEHIPQSRSTHFQVFCYCVAQATIRHAKFRSILLNSEQMRRFDHLNLGIAVALPEDELTTAFIPAADTLSFPEFLETMKIAIKNSRTETHEAAYGTMPLVITSLLQYGVTEATPILVPPAVAVLFLGDKFEQDGKSKVNLTLTFDHRMINGVGAAKFLAEVCDTIKRLGD